MSKPYDTWFTLLCLIPFAAAASEVYRRNSKRTDSFDVRFFVAVFIGAYIVGVVAIAASGHWYN